MNTRVLLAALAGGLTFFFLGWILYGMLLMDFMKANAGSATGVDRTDMQMWAMVASSLVWGLLLALLFSRWAGISTFRGGAIGGAWVSFLISLSMDLNQYSLTNLMTMNVLCIDPIAAGVLGALTGGVVGWVLGIRAKK